MPGLLCLFSTLVVLSIKGFLGLRSVPVLLCSLSNLCLPCKPNKPGRPSKLHAAGRNQVQGWLALLSILSFLGLLSRLRRWFFLGVHQTQHSQQQAGRVRGCLYSVLLQVEGKLVYLPNHIRAG